MTNDRRGNRGHSRIGCGIMFITIFTSVAKQAITFSEDDIIKKAEAMPEIRALSERYNQIISIIHEVKATNVYYSIIEPFPDEPSLETTKELRLK